MKKLLVKILIFTLMSFSLIAGSGGMGTLNIKTEVIPLGKTKKYLKGSNLILDSGVLNSESKTTDLGLAKVVVKMYTEKTDKGDGQNYNGIDGDFNNIYKLDKFKERLDNRLINLGTLTKYKGGENAQLQLYTKNLKIINQDIRNKKSSDENYVFVAYPEKATISNQIISLEYSFDLYLRIDGVKKGDIIRQDVTTGTGNEISGEPIGRIKDIIKDQFLELQK